jgi:hypothetical protein
VGGSIADPDVVASEAKLDEKFKAGADSTAELTQQASSADTIDHVRHQDFYVYAYVSMLQLDMSIPCARGFAQSSSLSWRE